MCCMCIIAMLRPFFFNDTAPTEIYTLSLHDALPIWLRLVAGVPAEPVEPGDAVRGAARYRRPGVRRGRAVPRTASPGDRKSTRLNSSHGYISYAVFCLKKKNKKYINSNNIHIHKTNV